MDNLINCSVFGHKPCQDKRRIEPVTICIAAISQYEDKNTRISYPIITGATDRMLTAGDIQFEPRQSKVAVLHKRIVALVAGDASFQTAVAIDAQNVLKDGQNVTVKYAAEIYGQAFSRYRREQAEIKYLSPLGLNLETFLQNQKLMSQETVDNLIFKLANHRIQAETIIAGIDSDNVAHLYTVRDPGRVDCQDMIGFAAIGAGEWHSQSLFMFNRYTRYQPFSEALFLTYAAKRRAEVAPGVGADTDMFILDSTASDFNYSYTVLNEHIMENIANIYKEYDTGINNNLRISLSKVDQFMASLIKQQQAGNPEPNDSASN